METWETLKITGLSVYFPTCTNCSLDITKKKKKKKKKEKVLDENQLREQAGFRKGHSTVDHRQTINQLIEKCNEFKRPFCIGYFDYKKAFDSTELETIFKALRLIGINETFITILEDIYAGATATVHMEEILILRGLRQGDPISPKLFTATIQEVLKNAQLVEIGINIEGQRKLENSGRGLLPAVEGHSLEQNRIANTQISRTLEK